MSTFKQRVFIFDGPDGTGKTEMSRALSRIMNIPYFKMTTERTNWRSGKFIEALRYDQPYIAKFLWDTQANLIMDRAYPAEYVYSRVFGRITDMDVLEEVDEQFAGFGTTIIIPLRRDYSYSRKDDLVPNDKLEKLHKVYEEFAAWTSCRTIKIYVDDFGNDLFEEIFQIRSAIDRFDVCLDLKNITCEMPGSKGGVLT